MSNVISEVDPKDVTALRAMADAPVADNATVTLPSHKTITGAELRRWLANQAGPLTYLNDERPTFREWLQANDIRAQITAGQWDDMIAREGPDLDVQFMNFSVSGIIPNSPWQYRHELWKRYGADTGALLHEEAGSFVLTWPEALRTNWQYWELINQEDDAS